MDNENDSVVLRNASARAVGTLAMGDPAVLPAGFCWHCGAGQECRGHRLETPVMRLPRPA